MVGLLLAAGEVELTVIRSLVLTAEACVEALGSRART